MDRTEVLHEVLSMLKTDDEVSIGTMFRRPAIRTGGKIVAFLSFSDDLIVKLPESRAQELVAAGLAEPVTMKDRTMREWIEIPADSDEASISDAWLPYAQEALEYIQALNNQAKDR